MEERKKKFEGFDGEKYKEGKMRKKIQLRKEKRADLAFCKRNIVIESIEVLMIDKVKVMDLLRSDQIEEQIEGLAGLKKLICLDLGPEYFEVGIMASINLLSQNSLMVSLYSTALLVAISNSNYSNLLSQWIPTFISFLPISHIKVQEDLYWILGNIALDSESNRKKLLENDLLKISIEILNSPNQNIIKKNICWCISHCCKHPISPEISIAIPILLQVFINNLVEIYPEVLLALANLSEVYQKEIVEFGILPFAVKLSKVHLKNIQKPAIRIIGNVLTGDLEYIHVLVKLKVIRCLSKALESKCKEIRCEAMWAISNLCGSDCVKEVIKNGVFLQIIELAVTDCLDIQKEAVWALANTIMICESSEIEELVNKGLLSAVCFLLGVVDYKLKYALLKSIGNALKKGEGFYLNPFVLALENNRGKDTIEEIANCRNSKVCVKASQILKKYFDDATEEIEIIPTTAYNF